MSLTGRALGGPIPPQEGYGRIQYVSLCQGCRLRQRRARFGCMRELFIGGLFPDHNPDDVELGVAPASADQGRAGRLGPEGREGHQRPRQIPDAGQASLGRSGHVRRGQGRPGRRVLRDRQLHAGAPRAAAAARTAGRRRHRRNQFGRVLAHPLEIFPAGRRVQGRQAARRLHAWAGPDVQHQAADQQGRGSLRHEDPLRRRHLRSRWRERSAPRPSSSRLRNPTSC